MHYIYDLETYPNVFTCSVKHAETGDRWYFEISERRNNLEDMMNLLFALRDSNAKMVGYNNVSFDYPVIHMMIEEYVILRQFTWFEITQRVMIKVNEIFNSPNRWMSRVWEPHIKQIDLFLIHHFDNMAKSTSLKALEFNMRSVSIVDLPFKPNTMIPLDGLPTLAEYNMHDVEETCKFFWYTKSMIDFRDELSLKYNHDFTNHNDTKIGKDYFVMQLGEERCYYRDPETNRRKPRQTSRPNGVPLRDVIFPYVQFEHSEFNRIVNWMKSQGLTSKDFEDTTTVGINTKGVFKDVHCIVDGFQFDFGTGGIHGSLHNQIIEADEYYTIIDVDVASYYPNIAIANRLFPEHLGETYCDIYLDVYNQRKQYDKKSSESAMLKLALNGVYGDSNNVYSPFFDPKYTMSITINGQLLLCMLAEQMIKIDGLSMIQINTDGLTIKVPRHSVSMVNQVCRWWENVTKLELEDVEYSKFYVRDVNNYMALKPNGSVKRIGAYAYETAMENEATREKPWHKDQSALVVQKAAEAYLVHGIPVEQYIKSPDRDIMDFMIRIKVNHAANLVWQSDDGIDHPQQSTSRYFVAHEGGYLFRVSPPPSKYTVGWYKKTNGVSDEDYFDWHEQNGNKWNPKIHTKNGSTYKERRDGITVSWKVEMCNDLRYANWSNLNHEYYISEANKLVEGVTSAQ